jgi:hypothetical protein
MSQFRVEKRRAKAELTLSTGESLRGCFFLAGSSATHPGPERVKDLLNCEDGFFPFETVDPSDTVLVNREHLVSAKLVESNDEAHRDSGYDVATRREIVMRLSNRIMLRGAVRVYRPQGRDRLSDYARSRERFRYIENADGTYIVNSTHIVDLAEIES